MKSAPAMALTPARDLASRAAAIGTKLPRISPAPARSGPPDREKLLSWPLEAEAKALTPWL